MEHTQHFRHHRLCGGGNAPQTCSVWTWILRLVAPVPLAPQRRATFCTPTEPRHKWLGLGTRAECKKETTFCCCQLPPTSSDPSGVNATRRPSSRSRSAWRSPRQGGLHCLEHCAQRGCRPTTCGAPATMASKDVPQMVRNLLQDTARTPYPADFEKHITFYNICIPMQKSNMETRIL